MRWAYSQPRRFRRYWNRWFAWHPVLAWTKTEDRTMVWLETIERKCVEVDDGWTLHAYRILGSDAA